MKTKEQIEKKINKLIKEQEKSISWNMIPKEEIDGYFLTAGMIMALKWVLRK